MLAIITAAMEEETTPIREIATAKDNAIRLGLKDSLRLLTIEDATLALVTIGMGLTNAVSSLTAAPSYVSPRHIFSCGPAGGLDTKAAVREVVASSDRVYGRADAREFGHELGQVPGMPASYIADEGLLSRSTAPSAWLSRTTTRIDRLLSSDCSVSAELAIELWRLFPSVITAGMESTALAQVTAGVEVPSLTIRGISDLCGSGTTADNYQRAPEASRLSLLVVLCLIGLCKPEEIAQISSLSMPEFKALFPRE